MTEVLEGHKRINEIIEKEQKELKKIQKTIN